MNANRLFLASRIALITTAMCFGFRANAVGFWATDFHLTHSQLGWVNGTAFWGFTLAMIFGGPLCDVIGLGRILGVAWVGHLAGIILSIFAWNFWSLYIGTLLFGIANGSVEAACNPLITTLFPNNKTTKLNHFHVWFPGGIVISGVLAYMMEKVGFGWKAEFATMLIPLVIYGIMFIGQPFPKTDRVQRGVSTGSMWLACLNPLFLLLVVCMLMTAFTELGSTTWIPNILTSAGVPGILVLAWINGLMAIGRQSAGTVVHKLSPSGVLLASSVVSFIGLYAMSHSSSAVMLYLSATIFAVGVCFFWPTMLGNVNERFPNTGALGLAIMGGAGMLSVGVFLPLVGGIFDQGIAARIPAGQTQAVLAAAPAASDLGILWSKIQAAAGLDMLGRIAVLPAILFVVFLILFLTRPKAHTAQAST
jgi:MFS family permease